MLTNAEIAKAAELLIGRYGLCNAHIAASFRSLELVASGQASAAIHWKAIADAIKESEPQSNDNRHRRFSVGG